MALTRDLIEQSVYYDRTLTAERARELFCYDPVMGTLTWRIAVATGSAKRKINVHPGDVAGSPNGDGALRVGVDGKQYLVHRVIFLMMTGRWPQPTVDHENRKRTDNRWENLREATTGQNGANRGVKLGICGLRGVSRTNAKALGWMAKITHNYKQRALGTFDCPAAAHFAYVVAASKAFGEFAVRD